MKQLLYIPNGDYCKFMMDGKVMSYGEYIYKCGYSDFNYILNCIIRNTHNGWDNFIKRNNLPEVEFLTMKQFEVIDV